MLALRAKFTKFKIIEIKNDLVAVRAHQGKFPLNFMILFLGKLGFVSFTNGLLRFRWFAKCLVFKMRFMPHARNNLILPRQIILKLIQYFRALGYDARSVLHQLYIPGLKIGLQHIAAAPKLLNQLVALLADFSKIQQILQIARRNLADKRIDKGTALLGTLTGQLFVARL